MVNRKTQPNNNPDPNPFTRRTVFFKTLFDPFIPGTSHMPTVVYTTPISHTCQNKHQHQSRM